MPESIRKIERPKNTIVVDHGGNGKKRFAVIQRVGRKRVNGKNIPINGATIGHICDGKYVPCSVESVSVSHDTIDIIDYADSFLVDRTAHSLLDELVKVYSLDDALKLYALACMKVLYPGITYSAMQEKYALTHLSMVLGNVPLSKNTISTFLNNP